MKSAATTTILLLAAALGSASPVGLQARDGRCDCSNSFYAVTESGDVGCPDGYEPVDAVSGVGIACAQAGCSARSFEDQCKANEARAATPTPVDDACEQPANEEQPPAEDEQPPAEDEQPPASEEQQPPAEDEQPPAEDEQPPAKDEQPPAEAQVGCDCSRHFYGKTDYWTTVCPVGYVDTSKVSIAGITCSQPGCSIGEYYDKCGVKP